MKRTALILLSLLGIGAFLSCEKDGEKIHLDTGNIVASQFLSPEDGSAYLLDEEMEEEPLFVFEWHPSDYNLDKLPDVNYLLQTDLIANNWDDPESIRDLVETRSTSFEMTVGEMNELLIRMGVSPGTEGEVSFRLLSFVTKATQHTWVYSDPVNLKFTPYEATLEVDILYVPGSYQGWDPSNENTVVYSLGLDGKYEAYLYFAGDEEEYKFTEGPNWDVNWGDNEGDGTLERSGSNIVAGDAGVYRINVDMNALTHANLRTEWTMIGTAVSDWDTDVPMELDISYFGETWKTRYTADVTLAEGAFKFRANSDWDLNLGMEEEDAEDGILSYSGPNISITEGGEYTVILDLSGPLYTVELIAR